MAAAVATVGIFLGKLVDQVQQAILDAQNAGLNLEVEAGREVSIAIENAKNAFSQSLNEAMDRIDRTARSTLDQLSSMVQEVQERNQIALKTIAARVQQLINTLPFAQLQPQVTDVSPRYIVPARQSYNVSIKFFGNFPFSSLAQFKPLLSIGGQKFAASENTTQELDFSVSSTVLFPPTSVDPLKCSLVSAELSLPWERSEWWGLKKVSEVAQYKIQIGALPSSPGRITFQYTTPRVVTERQRFVQGVFHLSSTREAGNNDQKDVPFTVTPHAGWHVIRGTSRVERYLPHGECTRPYFVSDAGDRVTYKASTIHISAGSAGIMDFCIGFDESREYTVQDPHTQNVALHWGDSVVLAQNVGKLVFDAFDGSHAEFAGADLSNRFIKIKDEGGNLIVSAADPAVLSIPSNGVAARASLNTMLRSRL